MNLVFLSTALAAQTNSHTDSPGKSQNNFGLYAGFGPNYYFNNLVLAKQFVNEFNYSISASIMWEPEHRLSLGLETGFYRLYTVRISDPDINITNDAIPISLVVCMRILRNIYFKFASGQTILLNKVTSSDFGKIKASTVSLGDFSGSLEYRKQLNDRFSLGSEMKFYYASKLDDKNIAFIFLLGYHF